MASTFTNLSYHIVFGTKYRRPLLLPDIRFELHKYIAGIIVNKGGQPLEIGGIADHVHVFAGCPAKVALAEFVRDIKANSSKWLREQRNLSDFQWQTGYAAFTVSYSVAPTVRSYVRKQEEHHKARTFEEEYVVMLERHGIAYDPRYVFDDEHHG